ncbi:DSBA oxidoreductase [Desulfonema ishimotonii]|uniref:DSBA oxidoreductase n=1 Tax=Desulfonema ishimotonii TaxID=45657 RepID=A0A401FY50_9BACT|nr:thioredoxin domain-containing protein [Desulfonema ishimotonii]GBC61889.1 DSBA oxidoreductase [Desulfonema ishimotonii]
MKNKKSALVTLASLILFSIAPAHASVEVSIPKTFRLEKAPLDVAVSRDGRKIFVLTAGEILVYTDRGRLDERIPVGKDIDGIETTKKQNLLYLKSTAEKTVQILRFDIIKEISTVGSPAKGPSDAPVVIVAFSDFQCPYCAKIATLLEGAVEDYPGEVRLVFKHYPLRYHKLAHKAAIASLAAHRQEKFWAFHDMIFQEGTPLTAKKIREIAGKIGLDMDRFDKDIKDPALAAQIKQDKKDGVDAGVTGTPTIFINGRQVRKRSFEDFYNAIDRALKQSKRSKKSAPEKEK